jgi:hypothetical protein
MSSAATNDATKAPEKVSTAVGDHFAVLFSLQKNNNLTFCAFFVLFPRRVVLLPLNKTIGPRLTF